jgi:DNA helicase II / ATP-dependent DNA helicase PcrA
MAGGHLDELTEEQRAVVACEVTAFVGACPGAGKTRTLAHAFIRAASAQRAAHGVAVLSFSRCAAEEVRRRCTDIGRPDLMAYPNFIDTFDAFIGRYLVAPFGSRWAQDASVQILDSWDRKRVNVVVPTAGRKIPVPLSAFRVTAPLLVDLDEQRLDPALRRLVSPVHAEANRLAERTRTYFLKRGLMTCEDARILALDRVRDPRGKTILRALAARFQVTIVDEAQDCNPADLEVIDAIRAQGTRVLLVADPEQAIYRFRGARPEDLKNWRAAVPNFTLSKNFRSTQVICAAASSLKSGPGPDDAAGSYAHEPTPVLLITYKKLTARVGEVFAGRLGAAGISPSSAVVLSHREDHAAAAVGTNFGRDSDSRLVRLANAVRLTRSSPEDVTEAVAAVELIEELLLARLDMNVEDLGEESQVRNARGNWMRSEAYRLLCRLLSRPVTDTPDERWVAFAQSELAEAPVPPWASEYVRTAKQVLRDKGWTPTQAGGVAIRALTIHKAKGREFDAVLVVLPSTSRVIETLDHWEHRRDSEARSVLYVGVTRARRLLALAVPADHADRVARLITRDGASCECVTDESGA